MFAGMRRLNPRPGLFRRPRSRDREAPGRIRLLIRHLRQQVIVVDTAGLRAEVEFFFNRHAWLSRQCPTRGIPTPRFAILTSLPYHLVQAFNRLIELGLPRDSPASSVVR